jgi:O-antigen/teichoic acid export membrane protein
VEVGVTEADGARLEPGAGLAAGPSHIVTLAKHTIVYGLSGVLLQAVGVVTLPIFARAFTQAEYGKLELGLVLSSVALTVVDLGFASAAQRSYYDYPETEAESRRKVLFTAIVSTSTVAVLVALILAALRGELDDWLFGGSNAERLILVIAISIPLVNAATYLRETMRLRFRQWSYVAAAVMAAIVSAAVSVILVVGFDAGIEAVFVGAIFGNALGVAYGIYVSHRDIGRHFSRPELRVMLAYGIPLVPAALAMWALALVDRVMLSRLGNLAEVGQYAVANRVASLQLLVVTAFSLAFGPYIFSIYSEDPEMEKAVRAKSLTYFTAVLLIVGLVLTLYAREVLELMAPAFDRAYKAVGPLCFGWIAFGISAVVASGISFARRTRWLPFIAGTAAAVNIVLNLVLIPPYGMVGAAIAAAVAYAVLAVLQHLVAQRLYPTSYETGKLARAFVLAVAGGSVGLVVIEPLWLSLVVKTAVLLGFLAALRLTHVVDATDLAFARRIVAARLRPGGVAP